MTARPCPQLDWFPTHCAACVQLGRSTPAAWIVNQGQGTRSYHACDKHRDLLERDGVAALRQQSRKVV
jgi:hypothetical protein